MYLVRIGMAKETVSRIGMFNAFLVMAIPLFVGKFITGKYIEAYTSNMCIRVYIFNMAFFLVSVMYFKSNQGNLSILLIGVNLLLTE